MIQLLAFFTGLFIAGLLGALTAGEILRGYDRSYKRNNETEEEFKRRGE